MSTLIITNDDLLDGWVDKDELEEWANYEDYTFFAQVEAVADRIHEIHTERGVPFIFCFNWVGVLEGFVDGAMVRAYIGGSRYLCRYVENKHLTADREATGLVQVFAIRDALMREYGPLAEYAANHDLEETP